jgi:hypothetical protein
MATIQSIRGGKDNDPEYFTRMRGQGPGPICCAPRFPDRLPQIRARPGTLSACGPNLFRRPAGPQGELF